jgi:hypothetical protein
VKFVQTYVHSNHPAWGDGAGPTWRVVDGLVDLKDGQQISGTRYSMVCGDDTIPPTPPTKLVFSARWVKPGKELEVVMDPYLGDKGWHGPWKNTTCRMKVKAAQTPNAAALQAEAAWVSPPPPIQRATTYPPMRLTCDPAGVGNGSIASVSVSPIAPTPPQLPCSVRP